MARTASAFKHIRRLEDLADYLLTKGKPIAKSAILKRAAALVLRVLVGTQAALPTFFHVFVHARQPNSEGGTAILLRGNRKLQQAFAEVRSRFSAIASVARFKTAFSRAERGLCTLFALALSQCASVYRASRASYREMFRSGHEHAFMHLKRATLLGAVPPQEMEKLQAELLTREVITIPFLLHARGR
jgi:hypothetical protein